MEWLQRYRDGDCEAVWREMLAEGPAARENPQARAVAQETMRRLRANLEVIHARLLTAGYVFADAAAALSPPTAGTATALDEIEAQLGPMPLSLRAFYEEVGSVDFRQSREQLVHYYREARAQASDLLILGEEDPLQVGDLDELREEASGAEGMLYFCFAADEFHKAGYSGGENYHVTLPNADADFVIEGMYGIDETFVYYLRQCMRFGGFRGKLGHLDWNSTEPPTKPGATLGLCAELARGLQPL